jgi:hypothetical protein
MELALSGIGLSASRLCGCRFGRVIAKFERPEQPDGSSCSRFLGPSLTFTPSIDSSKVEH